MRNSELLAYRGPAGMLTNIERQRQLLIRKDAVAQPCPSCGHEQDRFEAAGIDIDEADYSKVDNREYHCNACKRELRYVVPFVSMGGPGWNWQLVPTPVESGDG